MTRDPDVHKTLCFLTRSEPVHEVLLGYKKVGFGAGKYAGFGGGVEAGETLRQAALRELAEESGVQAAEDDIECVGHLTFCFPARPTWDQVVHVFRATRWRGEPSESREMRPAWFPVAQLPYSRMWQDAPHWLPMILTGERLRMRFVFAADCETVCEIHREAFTG